MEEAIATLSSISESTRRIYQLTASTVLGREATSDVPILDPLVSRRHAIIQMADDRTFVLTDAGSTHGTYVGEHRVSKVTLKSGDEIRVGSTRLRFDQQGDMVQAPLPAGDEMRVRQRVPVAPAQRFRAARDAAGAGELLEDYERLRAAHRITHAIGTERDRERLLHRILETAFELLPADRGAIVLVDPRSHEPTTRVFRVRCGTVKDVVLPWTILREAMASRTGIISADAGSDQRFNRSGSIAAQKLRSTISVPMLHADEVLGVIHLDSVVTAAAFGAKDLELFTTIATQAALAMKNVLLQDEIHHMLAEEHRRLDRVIRELPTGILLLDANARIVLVNRRAEELLPGLSDARRNDVLTALGGIPIGSLLASRGGAPLEISVPGVNRRVYLASAAAFQIREGAATETVLAIQDVTEAREQEQRSARQDRMTLVGQLAGGVAHDFNNLLAVILSYSDFVAEQVEEVEVKHDVEMIREAAQKAAGLTRDLLAFSSREVVTPKSVDCNRVVQGMLELLRRALGEEVRLVEDLGASLSAVRVDPGRLEQVIMNLGVNARDAMSGRGTLSIRTANMHLAAAETHNGERLSAGDYVVVSVADTGCGMTPEVAARIFEPFFSTKERGKGTGLGLATVYGIVKQAGGAIGVELAPGAGTTFHVYLPVDPEGSPSERPRTTRAAPPLGTESILVVEDEPAVRRLAARMLRAAGYAVAEAACAIEAIEACDARADRFDLLLTDVVMPGASGWDLAVHLRQKWLSLPVVFMTGYSDTLLCRPPGEEPPCVVQKPFDRDEMLRRIREALDARRPLRAAVEAPR